jgi:hypothetical protein
LLHYGRKYMLCNRSGNRFHSSACPSTTHTV